MVYLFAELPEDSRLSLNNEILKLRAVTLNDSQVFQCKASNTHGHILVNAYLSVRGK